MKSNDEKTTPEAFRAYKRWQKYILSTRFAMPKGHDRHTLLAYCLAMAIHGTNGQECFASDSTIGEEIGISNREIVGKYRRLAIKLGWFVPTGKKRGRAEELSIAIPTEAKNLGSPRASEAEAPSVRQTSAPPPVADAEHDAWVGTDLEACPACRPLLSTRERGEVEMIHVRVINARRPDPRANAPLG